MQTHRTFSGESTRTKPCTFNTLNPHSPKAREHSPTCAARRRRPYLEDTAWSLDKETRPGTGEPFSLLMVCMVKREPTESERQYKRNEAQDNRWAVSDANPHNRKGVRLFAEDQDDFGLEDDLMALCFLETGETWRPAKPWDKFWGGGRVDAAGAGCSTLSLTHVRVLDSWLARSVHDMYILPPAPLRK